MGVFNGMKVFNGLTLMKGTLAFLVALSANVFAGESLQVLPTRVVFDKERSAELTLANKGDEQGQYRILLRNLRTDDMGAFTHAKTAESDEKFADDMIRFSPRSISITPSGYQKVRLMVRKPRDLEPGEYRTHMVFQSVPPEVPSVLDESNDVTVEVRPIVELTIPIIIRHGEVSAKASLQSPSFSDGKVLFELHRDGNRSLYGDISVFLDNNGAPGKQVGFIKGISVYVPNSLRKLAVPVSLDEKPDTQFIVQFEEDKTYGGKESVTLSF